MPNPKIVCLCGSTKFYDQYQEANLQETLKGHIVLSVGVFVHNSEKIHGRRIETTGQQKDGLDKLHKQKVGMADEILVINVGGYIGKSTQEEIELARSQGKLVRFWETEQPTATHVGEPGVAKRTTNMADPVRVNVPGCYFTSETSKTRLYCFIWTDSLDVPLVAIGDMPGFKAETVLAKPATLFTRNGILIALSGEAKSDAGARGGWAIGFNIVQPNARRWEPVNLTQFHGDLSTDKQKVPTATELATYFGS